MKPVLPMPSPMALVSDTLAAATRRERALRAEVHALRGAVKRLEGALAERTARVTDIELALLKMRGTVQECIRMLKHAETA